MAVIYKSGDLRRKMAIQQRSTAQDALGGQSEVWTDIAPDVWCQIQPLSSYEKQAAAAVQANLTHQITFKYHPRFADPKAVAAMRGVYKGRIFNFQPSENIDERNVLVTISATEGMTNG